jgi:glycosyltransferase involved in cell wall biosynthesis
MSWYSKYLSAFEKPIDSVARNIYDEVKNNLRKFDSSNPIATVAIAAYNEETRLLACLWSLSDNICHYPIEIIGINNNSTDRTQEVFDAVGVKSYVERKQSCGYARNCGLDNAKGKYYICIDADTIYPPHYLKTCIERLQNPGVVGVYSLWSFVPDGKASRVGLWIYETLRDMHVRALARKSPELNVRGMTFAHYTEYGRKIRYRVDIKRGEDGSMALGLKKYGRIELITGSKTRVATCTSTLNAKGSLTDNFRIEIVKGVKHFKGYFKRRHFYQDRESNLISIAKDEA